MPVCGQRGGEQGGSLGSGTCPPRPQGEYPYPQRLGHQAGQGGAVGAQLPKGLHLAHLYQDPVGTDSWVQDARCPCTPPSHLQQAAASLQAPSFLASLKKGRG